MVFNSPPPHSYVFLVSFGVFRVLKQLQKLVSFSSGGVRKCPGCQNDGNAMLFQTRKKNCRIFHFLPPFLTNAYSHGFIWSHFLDFTIEGALRRGPSGLRRVPKSGLEGSFGTLWQCSMVGWANTKFSKFFSGANFFRFFV